MKNFLTFLLLLSIQMTLAQEGFETLDGTDYSIKYPGTWEIDQSGQMGMSFALFSPIKFDGDQFRENVNLVIQDLTGYDLDLVGYANISENQIRSMMQDSEILISEKKGDYHLMVYSATMGQYKLKFSQRYWISQNKAYILTFTAEQSEYDNYEGIGHTIMDSFNIKQD